MDFQYYGANCLGITIKQTRILIDDNLSELGSKSAAKPNDIMLYTSPQKDTKTKGARITIDCPGEYEVGDVSIFGIEAKPNAETKDIYSTIYKLLVNDLSVVIIGDIAPELSDTQLEAIGVVDILTIPVGGNGYSLDAAASLKLVREIAPKLVIPTHYADKAIKYPVAQDAIEDVLKVFSMEPKETTTKLRVKPADLSETMQLVLLEKTAS